MTIMIDTLKLSSRLVESGMDRKQAEALSVSLSESLKDGDLATKLDIEKLRVEIISSRNQMMAAMLAIAGLTLAAVKILF